MQYRSLGANFVLQRNCRHNQVPKRKYRLKKLFKFAPTRDVYCITINTKITHEFKGFPQVLTFNLFVSCLIAQLNVKTQTPALFTFPESVATSRFISPRL